LFTLPGGNVGIAAGVEWRRETFFDDRDPRLDGTITFTDSVTGVFNGSDVAGTSPSPDTNGVREVYSAFAEVFVPFVSPEMDIRWRKVRCPAGRADRAVQISSAAVVHPTPSRNQFAPGRRLGTNRFRS
jgi:hypothetical protein